ncbi:MAG: PHB depolymerase family esterase [Planctomycetota bacterium]
MNRTLFLALALAALLLTCPLAPAQDGALDPDRRALLRRVLRRLVERRGASGPPRSREAGDGEGAGARALIRALRGSPAERAARDARLAQSLGLTQASLRHEQRERTFYYAGAEPSAAPRPVLFVLHGGSGSGPDMAHKTGYTELARDHGFVVVYPNGWEGNWNDGRGERAKTGVDVSGIDDVGFFAKLFDHAVEHLGGDPRRLYVTGLSNGGTLSYRLGIELTDRIAAIAPVIANLPGALQGLTPSRPLPVLIMNGTADPLMTWDGERAPDGRVKRLSTPETVAWWVRHNGAASAPTTARLLDLDPGDGSTVEVSAYAAARAPVVLYTIHGGGHTFPGSNVPDVAWFVGPKNRDLHGPEAVWTFLSGFTRD